jgi:hypothetical protein
MLRGPGEGGLSEVLGRIYVSGQDVQLRAERRVRRRIEVTEVVAGHRNTSPVTQA